MIETIRYAFREDPLNAYMLAIGTNESEKYDQFFSFRKRPVSSSLLDQFCYLDSKTPGAGQLTYLGKDIQQKGWTNPFTFVVRIDSQVEFTVRRGVFEQLTQLYYPLWTPDVPLSFFAEQPSGFITILRVYRARSKLDEQFLAKGRKGSSQIIQLYDVHMPVSVQTEILDPVIPDSRFEYLKDEIIYLLKKENVYIGLYENNDAGKTLLDARNLASQAMLPKRERVFDPYSDSQIDMAQSDYQMIYSEIKQIAPGMSRFVDYVSSIRPAQIGEFDYLLKSAKQGNKSNKERIIEMNMRLALKSALWIHKKYGVDLEDATSEAMIGLLIAFDKYDINNETKFGPYASLWIRQIMIRYLPIGEYNVRFPVHVREKIINLLDYLATCDYDITRECEPTSDMIVKAAELLSCDEITAKHIWNLLTPPFSIEWQVEHGSEYEDPENNEDGYLNQINLAELSSRIKAVMEGLKDRERRILCERYGIDSPEYTLEEIGQELSLTRERIRQIEEKALTRLRHPSRAKKLKPFWDEM